jgi:DNA (cytosine-5)-methyltransferase 1
MRVIDLFSGCGGMSLGFQNAGYEICSAFDHWKPAVNVYRKNFDHPIIEADLGKFDGDVGAFTLHRPEMIIGGPPCQDFSSAGKRDESLGRADLTVVFARIVTAVAPRWFVMENVRRAVTSKAFTQARTILNDAGYKFTQRILDASLCGVPQTRKRLFLIGELNGEEDGVGSYLDDGLAEKRLTVREHLGDALQIDHYYRHPRSYERRAIFSVDEPSATIRGVNRPVPDTYRNHAGDTAPVTPNLRPLTTKERSLIQTFPPDFIFEGTKADMEQMIGNAVPVKLAQYVAEAIRRYIDDRQIVEVRRKPKRKPEQLAFI